MSHALSLTDFGMVLVDAQASVQFAEDHGVERILRAGLRINAGRLACDDEVASARLRRAIRQVAAGAGPIALADEAGEGQIVVAPLPAIGKGAQFVFVLATGAGPEPAEGRLQATYGLTPAEARLLRALIGGMRLADYAAEVGVSESTVKTHLRNLFDKTGERRQSDLIRRAMSDPRLRVHAD